MFCRAALILVAVAGMEAKVHSQGDHNLHVEPYVGSYQADLDILRQESLMQSIQCTAQSVSELLIQFSSIRKQSSAFSLLLLSPQIFGLPDTSRMLRA